MTTHADTAVRVGGAWLALASALMMVTLALHGPIPPDMQERMTMVAEAAGRWTMVHWIAAAALSLYAVSGLIVLTSRSRLIDGSWLLTAWAVICVGSLWTMTTAVAEATVVAEAAASGREEAFAAWWGFAEGKGNGFALLALGVATIAATEARVPAGATPARAVRIGAVAGAGSFVGWSLGMWVGIGAASVLWVVSSLAMCLWTLWFGVALMRLPAAAAGAGTERRARIPA